MQNFHFLALNSLSCKGSGLSLACLFQNNPVEEKSIISVPFSEKQIDIIVSNHSITLRISLQRYCIVSRMPQRSSHTLDETINPSRLLNQLSDVDHVDLRGCEVCGFQDMLWTQRITLTEDSE